jgi:hypothetical protein
MDSKNPPLKAILCGYERGGTSLIAELLRQHPDLDGGFEGGFLLGKSPRDFLSISPYRSNVKLGWGISEEELQHACDTDSWQEVYRRLREKAGEIRDKRVWLFDKTPKYMEALPKVLRKVPDIPCIVVVRDPRAVLWSWAKRSGMDTESWIREHLRASCKRYVRYGKGWQAAIKAGLASRILLLRYEAFCADPAQWAERLFGFLGLEFHEAFMQFHPRFPNVYGNRPAQQYIYEYKGHFPEKLCRKILSRTKRLRDWHW